MLDCLHPIKQFSGSNLTQMICKKNCPGEEISRPGQSMVTLIYLRLFLLQQASEDSSDERRTDLTAGGCCSRVDHLGNRAVLLRTLSFALRLFFLALSFLALSFFRTCLTLSFTALTVFLTVTLTLLTDLSGTLLLFDTAVTVFLTIRFTLLADLGSTLSLCFFLSSDAGLLFFLRIDSRSRLDRSRCDRCNSRSRSATGALS